MRFVQKITVRATDGEALAKLMSEWHEAEAGKAPGYLGSRLLADRDEPGHYMVLVNFSSPEEAEQNNERPETQEWAAKLAGLVDGEPDFANFDDIHTVG